jgi:hypothetical protein
MPKKKLNKKPLENDIDNDIDIDEILDEEVEEFNEEFNEEFDEEIEEIPIKSDNHKHTTRKKKGSSFTEPQDENAELHLAGNTKLHLGLAADLPKANLAGNPKMLTHLGLAVDLPKANLAGNTKLHLGLAADLPKANLAGNAIFEELIAKQLDTVPLEMKLSVSDMKRICKYIKTSIFGDECCFWYGYVTNANTNKGIYVNFYFKSKKVALHRLLYSNFVAPLTESEYLKINCPNRNGSGVCCNVNHYEKYHYIHTNTKTKTKPATLKTKTVTKAPKIIGFEATEVEIDFD